MSSTEISKIASYLVDKRGTIAHGGWIEINDIDAQKIKFLEIITQVLLLQRVGIPMNDIEKIIGSIFGCNYIMFNERMEH